MMSGYRIFPAGHPHGMGHVRPHYHGFCSACCHPISKCCCGHRECRKVAKELLADPMVKEAKELPPETKAFLFHLFSSFREMESGEKVAAGATEEIPGRETKASAVIGGGCCVHLSIEYMPVPKLLSKGGVPTLVSVAVMDSEGTGLVWQKVGIDGYNVKEDIITTNPGARLMVMALNAVARVRWCEVFSC